MRMRILQVLLSVTFITTSIAWPQNSKPESQALLIAEQLTGNTTISASKNQASGMQEQPGKEKDEAVVVVNEPPEIAKFIDDVQALVLRENFEKLDKVADEVRKSKARFPGGGWKLTRFYEAVNKVPDSYASSDQQWRDHLALLQRWKAAKPQSITARVALAEAYREYAWQARGSGFANTVTEQGWKLFADRLKLAQKELVDAAALHTMCPHWYLVMQKVALASGADKEQLRAVFERAIAYEPDYFAYYQQHAYALLPKWVGAPGDVEAFAGESSRQQGGKKGAYIYFEIASNLCNACGDFSPQGFSWSRIQEGFAALEEFYRVTPLKLNRFAMLAAAYGDKAVAAKTFLRIGPNWDASVWGSRARFEAERNWAGLPASLPPVQSEITVSPDQRVVQMLILAEKARSESRWDDSTRLAKQAIEMAKPLPGTGESLRDAYLLIAKNEREQGRLSEAQTMLDHAATEVAKKAGADSIELALTLDFKSVEELDMKDDVRAEADIRRAMAIREKVNGTANAPVAVELQLLGDICERHGRFKEAGALLQKSADAYEAIQHDNVAMAYPLRSLASIYQREGRNAEAEALYLRALKLNEGHFGANSSDVRQLLVQLAFFYRATGQQDAEARISERLNTMKANATK
jgi:tetratricopeptide (TPR) repeat protein